MAKNDMMKKPTAMPMGVPAKQKPPIAKPASVAQRRQLDVKLLRKMNVTGK